MSYPLWNENTTYQLGAIVFWTNQNWTAIDANGPFTPLGVVEPALSGGNPWSGYNPNPNTVSAVGGGVNIVVTGTATQPIVNTLTDVVFTTIEGDLSGNVTGDLTGNVTGNVVGDLSGNVTGNVTGNVVGDLSGASVTTTALSVPTITDVVTINGVGWPPSASTQLVTVSDTNINAYIWEYNNQVGGPLDGNNTIGDGSYVQWTTAPVAYVGATTTQYPFTCGLWAGNPLTSPSAPQNPIYPSQGALLFPWNWTAPFSGVFQVQATFNCGNSVPKGFFCCAFHKVGSAPGTDTAGYLGFGSGNGITQTPTPYGVVVNFFTETFTMAMNAGDYFYWCALGTSNVVNMYWATMRVTLVATGTGN